MLRSFGRVLSPGWQLSLAGTFFIGSILASNAWSQSEAGNSTFRFVPTDGRKSYGAQELQAGLPAAIDANKLLASSGLKAEQLDWLGTLRYGGQRARSIAIALTDDSPPRLFADLDRDHVFGRDELLPTPESPVERWLVNVDAEYVSDESKREHQTQRVALEFDRSDRTMTARTAGTMSGSTVYQGQQCVAHYEDRNANGRWFDPGDRLFVDLNHDGRAVVGSNPNARSERIYRVPAESLLPCVTYGRRGIVHASSCDARI